MSFTQLVAGVFERLLIVVGAFLGSQIPMFMHQYKQRLEGHAEELQHLLENMRLIASYSNKTLPEYITKFLDNPDPDFSKQGEFLQMMMQRWQNLSEALLHLRESPIWEQPYFFIKYFNKNIAEATLNSFQPGLSLTLEGLCYTGLGILVAYISYQTLVKILKKMTRRTQAAFKRSS